MSRFNGSLGPHVLHSGPRAEKLAIHREVGRNYSHAADILPNLPEADPDCALTLFGNSSSSNSKKSPSKDRPWKKSPSKKAACRPTVGVRSAQLP